MEILADFFCEQKILRASRLRRLTSAVCYVLERLAGRLDRAVDVFIRVRTAHEERLELARGEVDALLEHGLEPDFERVLVRGARVIEVPDFALVEEDAEHAAGLVRLDRDAGFFRLLLPAEQKLFLYALP